MTQLIKPSRRTLLKGAAATSLVLAAPITLRAQPTIVRKSLATSDSDSDVATYREAVKFMLTQAEPDDPKMFHLNWYRNAMIHLLDCPHGNWWFAVWHRPYLGYLEQKIRTITGNEEFALPFWDWSEQPYIPAAFLSDPNSSDPDIRDNPLDPTSSYFVNAPHDQSLIDPVNEARAEFFKARNELEIAEQNGDQEAANKARADMDAAIQAFGPANTALMDHNFEEFDKTYRSAFEQVWNSFNTDQTAQLTARFPRQDGQTPIDFDWFWRGSGNSVRSNWQWDVETARFLKIGNSDLTGDALSAVEKSKIESSIKSLHFALRPDETGGTKPDYGFNTVEVDNHHGFSRSQAILEGQPHNLVHNATGAVMQSNLSSIDPIFFAHHCNVDRIWDVWTRRQMSFFPQRPHLPEHNVSKFNGEEFLFYIVPDGMPVEDDTNAGAFMDKDRFGYNYAPGTGADQVEPPLVFGNFVTESFAAPLATGPTAFDDVAAARVQLDDKFSPVFSQAPDKPNVLAEITTTLPMSLAGLTVEVFVSPKGKAPDKSDGSPEFAGAIGFFGMNELMGHEGHRHDADEPAVFDMDITQAIERLTSAGDLSEGGEFDVSINPVRTFGKFRNVAPSDAVLQSVRLKTI